MRREHRAEDARLALEAQRGFHAQVHRDAGDELFSIHRLRDVWKDVARRVSGGTERGGSRWRPCRSNQC